VEDSWVDRENPRRLLDEELDNEPDYNDDEKGWETALTPTPDVSDKSTVVNLAKMCSDAYVLAPTEPDWLNSSMGFNHSDGFGWEGGYGLRGHVFADSRNKTVIVAFKGTTPDLPRGSPPSPDRLNDNLLFSCCCADQRPDPYWYGSVCDCSTDQYRCNSTCLTRELVRQDRYYSTALAVMRNVTSWYIGPSNNATTTTFWVVGHSLGGSIASLVGLTLHMPSVSFEAPPQKLAAQRLGIASLDTAGRHRHSFDYHIGNTADPVFMGACNGFFSSCSIAGYAFESQCHSGKRCVYDTVGDKGWHLGINNHRLNVVIPDVLEAYDTTPKCEADDECVDCYNWNFNASSNLLRPG
jgi:lipase ATG15